jgi:hypothetical protein
MKGKVKRAPGVFLIAIDHGRNGSYASIAN